MGTAKGRGGQPLGVAMLLIHEWPSRDGCRSNVEGASRELMVAAFVINDCPGTIPHVAFLSLATDALLS